MLVKFNAGKEVRAAIARIGRTNGKSEHPSNTVGKFELLVQSVTDYAICARCRPPLSQDMLLAAAERW